MLSSRGATLIAGGIAVLALCGSCGPPQEDGVPVGAAQLPHPRPGLWLWASRANGERRLCLSGQVLTVLSPRPGCQLVRQVRTDDGAFVVEALCGSGSPIRTYVKASGDFAAAFSTVVAVDDVSDHADYRYLGPCPPGRRPDDQP